MLRVVSIETKNGRCEVLVEGDSYPEIQDFSAVRRLAVPAAEQAGAGPAITDQEIRLIRPDGTIIRAFTDPAEIAGCRFCAAITFGGAAPRAR